MIYNYYLIGLFIATVLGWTSWAVVIRNLSPFTSGYLALSLFYASLIIALTGTFSIIIYYLRSIFSDSSKEMSKLNTSLRQGSLLSAMIAIGLIFQRLRVLTWWDTILLLAIVLLIEYYFSQQD